MTANSASTLPVVNPIHVSNVFELAQEALDNGEVPVACLFIYRGDVIASSRNKTNETHNGVAHAEINCLDMIVRECKSDGESIMPKLSECDVLVTVEPCIMCARALRASRVRRVIFGANNDRFGGCGTVMSVHNDPSLHDPILECHPGGLDPNRAISLLQNFYQGENMNAPEEKKTKKRIKKE